MIDLEAVSTDEIIESMAIDEVLGELSDRGVEVSMHISSLGPQTLHFELYADVKPELLRSMRALRKRFVHDAKFREAVFHNLISVGAVTQEYGVPRPPIDLEITWDDVARGVTADQRSRRHDL